jgi:hypothetical protein
MAVREEALGTGKLVQCDAQSAGGECPDRRVYTWLVTSMRRRAAPSSFQVKGRLPVDTRSAGHATA